MRHPEVAMADSKSKPPAAPSFALPRNMLCGGAAAAIATGTLNPLDTLRVRWQISPVAAAAGGAQVEGSLLAYARGIVATEGFVRGLWAPGCTATMSSMGTSAGIRMGAYPFLRDWVAGGASQKTPALMFGTGLFAGAFGYWASCPFFQAKTRLQAAPVLRLSGALSAEGPRTTLGTLKSVWHEGGLKALYRGSTPLACRGACFGAGQMLGYDGTKTALSQRTNIMNDGPPLHFLASVVAALFATVLSAPADYVMTRYQTAFQIGKPYSNPAACVRDIVQKDGMSAFFRGWTPYFGRIAPALLIVHPLFEQFRLLLGLGYMG